jgi:hypothetical protein
MRFEPVQIAAWRATTLAVSLRANQVGGLGALAWKNLSKLLQFVRRQGA